MSSTDHDAPEQDGNGFTNIAEEVAGLVEQRQLLTQRVRELERETENLRAQMGERDELEEELKELKALQYDKGALEREIASLKEQVAQRQELEAENARLREHQGETDSLQAEIQKLKTGLEDREHLLAELEESRIRLKERDDRARLLKEKEEELSEVTERLEQAEARIGESADSEETLSVELETTQGKLISREQELEAIQKVLQDQRNELSSAQAELNLARQEALKATGKVKSDYLNSMGQDIQSSMNAIMEMSSKLSETFLDAEQEKFVNSLWQSSSSLIGMLNNILEISQIEAGTLKLNPTSFDPRETVEGVIGCAREHAESKGLEFGHEVDPRSPQRVIGDEERIRQVLMKLLENAVKHTSSGRISITLGTSEEPQGVAMMRFSVTDTGRGIPAEKLETLFDQPEHLQSVSTMPSPHAASFSLHLSKQLVELMGGQMGVDSHPGQGSTFHFELKLAVVETSEKEAPAEAEVEAVLEES